MSDQWPLHPNVMSYSIAYAIPTPFVDAHEFKVPDIAKDGAMVVRSVVTVDVAEHLERENHVLREYFEDWISGGPDDDVVARKILAKVDAMRRAFEERNP